MIKILFIGDISGEMGKIAVESELPKLKKELNIDYVIANAENTTKGRGLNWTDYRKLSSCGIDFFTMGNHTWHKRDIYDILKTKNNIIRPANLKSVFEESKVGFGTKVVTIKNKTFRITNLLGISVSIRDMQTNPFIELQNIIDNSKRTDFHIVDFHCETTSEKNAFFINFQGAVSAILGTHTHVQTNDAKIINNTAYITDVGMTGASNGVIGAKPDSIIYMFKGYSDRFKLEEQIGPYQFCGVILSFNEHTNKVVQIKKVYLIQDYKKISK
ncbi:TIGR00282 family metallophosphoesterase [Malacoplasma penetrans]|uniref:Metallophosphoesterase n=1 Tax=Malacoplasma penetrans (strain HF-2) TaxID=272633 RepID=Q8EUN1_MALP2|nr:TIGR00282 family metallophosphoesterase [Malacoplasma penetrans]BAC44681.1 conserved hypothetical protein [Malacoplasma penetrans HF-2]